MLNAAHVVYMIVFCSSSSSSSSSSSFPVQCSVFPRIDALLGEFLE